MINIIYRLEGDCGLKNDAFQMLKYTPREFLIRTPITTQTTHHRNGLCWQLEIFALTSQITASSIKVV